MDDRLKRDGVPAQAQVLAVQGNRVGHHDQPFPVPVRFRLRVHPQAAAPVEVEFDQMVPNDLVYHLEPGVWVPVVHDPADPSKVAVDVAEESAASQVVAQQRVAAQQAYMETIKQVTGQDPNRPASPADVTATIQAAQRLIQQNASVAEWAKMAGSPGPQPPPGAPVTGALSGDPVERIERLVKLRESGAITDEEFERLKRQIVDG